MGGVFMTMTTISLLQALVCYIAIEYGLGHELLGSIPAYIVGCLVTAFCGGSFGKDACLQKYISMKYFKLFLQLL